MNSYWFVVCVSYKKWFSTYTKDACDYFRYHHHRKLIGDQSGYPEVMITVLDYKRVTKEEYDDYHNGFK